jgi:hypothetical protein
MPPQSTVVLVKIAPAVQAPLPPLVDELLLEEDELEELLLEELELEDELFDDELLEDELELLDDELLEPQVVVGAYEHQAEVTPEKAPPKFELEQATLPVKVP